MSVTEGHRQRLRRRFEENPNSLSDTERLELLLTHVIRRRDTAPMARDMMAHFGSLEAVFEANAEELIEIDGVGKATANYIVQLSDAERSQWVRQPEEPKQVVGAPLTPAQFI